MEEPLVLAGRLRELLVENTKTAPYSQHNNQTIYILIANVHFAVCLYELGILIGRPISHEEEFYFNGQYQVSRFLCDGQFEELSTLYDKLVIEVSDRNFFRK